ncbi:MAG TPA: hypothetical protein VJV75_08095 [Candidatus Polarisedimenticolia bacterium]|nr:hypothetical protein [Candidatus Polarisedimenticolia bacterium]
MLLWSTLIFPLCWALSGPYQHGLAEVIRVLVSLTGRGLRISGLETFAPADIGLFVSLCLASGSVPWKIRLRAVARGVPLLAALQVAVLLAATFFILSHQHGALPAEFFVDLPHNLLRTIGWVNPPLAWLALLGKWELPSPGRRLHEHVVVRGTR